MTWRKTVEIGADHNHDFDSDLRALLHPDALEAQRVPGTERSFRAHRAAVVTGELVIWDETIHFVRIASEKASSAACDYFAWLGVIRGEYYDWRRGYGWVGKRNTWIPRDFWL